MKILPECWSKLNIMGWILFPSLHFYAALVQIPIMVVWHINSHKIILSGQWLFLFYLISYHKLHQYVIIILLPHIDYTNILTFNTWRQSDTYICQWTRLSLVQVKACCLINTMQSATPMMLTVNWTLWNKLQWNWRLHLWKRIGKFWSFGSSLVDCYMLEIMCTSINSVLLLQIPKIWGNSPLDLLFQK